MTLLTGLGWRFNDQPKTLVGLALVAISLFGVTWHLIHRKSFLTTIIVGDGPLAAVLNSILEEERPQRFSWLQRNEPAPLQQMSSLSEAEATLQSGGFYRVILADSAVPETPSLDGAAGRHTRVVDGVDLLERTLNRTPLEFAGGRVGAQVDVDFGVAYRAIKRMSDILMATGLAILLLPILPVIALAIALDSPGSVLYRQDRIGLNGRTFRIYKFRTMRADAESDGAKWAEVNDCRVTRLGRVLRQSRVDELPQIWNVLRGDMTFVGPRPERPEFTAELEREIPCYGLRHSVKPGITGWAQVKFRYTNSLRDSRVKMEYDLYYLRHASFLLDLRILLLTVLVVLGKKGV